ncbi:hypothetical protein E2542_SST00816 [Spatholobus suberectus]|nr:hypothetical protein E2542_SST00816 [Spatholobus suberectus]
MASESDGDDVTAFTNLHILPPPTRASVTRRRYPPFLSSSSSKSSIGSPRSSFYNSIAYANPGNP